MSSSVDCCRIAAPSSYWLSRYRCAACGEKRQVKHSPDARVLAPARCRACGGELCRISSEFVQLDLPPSGLKKYLMHWRWTAIKQFGGKCVHCGELNIHFLAIAENRRGAPLRHRHHARIYQYLHAYGERRRDVHVHCYNCSRSCPKRRGVSTLRQRFIASRGGQCECCGEDSPLALTLEHVGGWGYRHRSAKTLTQCYLDALGNRIAASKFQLLCMNCNFLRRRSMIAPMTRCPHRNSPESLAANRS